MTPVPHALSPPPPPMLPHRISTRSVAWTLMRHAGRSAGIAHGARSDIGPGGSPSPKVMSSVITQGTTGRATEGAGDRPPARLKLKSEAPTTGYVDGAWWPRSRDLAAELPALLAVLRNRLGRVERVSYNLNSWGPTERKIQVDGVVVRLAGYRSQHRDTVDVLGPRLRLTLLVVPPQSTAQAAHGALIAAAQLGNTDSIERLLRADDPLTWPGVTDGTGAAEAEQRWELDGGRVSADV
jgi:Family of unknown function (DUF5994)